MPCMKTCELGCHTLQWQLGFHVLYENMRWEPRDMLKNTKTWELLKLTRGNSLWERPFAYEVRYTKIV